MPPLPPPVFPVSPTRCGRQRWHPFDLAQGRVRTEAPGARKRRHRSLRFIPRKPPAVSVSKVTFNTYLRASILIIGYSRPGTTPHTYPLGGTMSPLVQRHRAQSTQQKSTDQHWGMLLYESFSAGAMVVLVGLLAVMVVVGLYLVIVWPLTYWDLANTGLEKYGSLANAVVWALFAGGSLAGFWCFSGAAFKSKSQRPATPARPARSPRR